MNQVCYKYLNENLVVVITRRDDEEVDEAAKKLQGISPPLSKIKNNREALRINNLHGHLSLQ